MLLEWLRRHDPVLSEMLKTYLFTEGAILEIEEADAGDGGSGEAGDGSLGIGSLRGA